MYYYIASYVTEYTVTFLWQMVCFFIGPVSQTRISVTIKPHIN